MIRGILSSAYCNFTRLPRRITIPIRKFDTDSKDDRLLKDDLSIPGIHLDDLDELIFKEALQPLDDFRSESEIITSQTPKFPNSIDVYVIQPWNTFASFDGLTDPKLQLDECVSLANTIPGWNVSFKEIMFSRHLHTKELVGSKQLSKLDHLLKRETRPSAVFFGVEILSGVQLATLEKTLGVPVYDRYNVVLNIFRHHARTSEAKIQLALAELPYVKNRLREIHESTEFSSISGPLKNLTGGDGERLYYKRLEVLKRREKKLLKLLGMLRKHQDSKKKSRKRNQIPIISVVGYTNCGKTSLIKALTEDKDMMPKDQLFATLDVTAHGGFLNNNRMVIYLDTVGFISRIPILLYDAFSATLRDIIDSNLLVHVYDVNHPDYKNQYATVVKCLEALKVPKQLMTSRITVANKIDLCEDEGKLPFDLPDCDLKISATKGGNLNELSVRMDNQLILNLQFVDFKLRVPNTGPKYGWLRKNATIRECLVDDDSNDMVCTVSMSPAAIGRWRKLYGSADIIVEETEET